MKHVIPVLALIATLSGCATQTTPLTSNIGNSYRGKSITYSVRQKADFTAYSSDKAIFNGAIWATSPVEKGNKIISENKVPDPAISIGAALANELASKYGLIVKKPSKITSSKKTNQIAADYGDADLVLDVQTHNWGFFYFPTDWSHYYIMYGAKLKLIDTKKEYVLASGAVSYDSKNNSKHLSYGQLTNNNAAGLKQELTKAKEYCITESSREIFNAR